MCDPTTAALVFTAASGGFSAMQGIQQGNYQNKLAQRNATMQEAQARDASARGVIAGEQQRTRTQQMLGRQATALAGSGLDISSGTSLDLFAETATLGEYDRQVAENNAAREAFGLQARAEETRLSGRNAKTAGRNNAFGTLLTTGAQSASLYR